jgi:hypothetical protein
MTDRTRRTPEASAPEQTEQTEQTPAEPTLAILTAALRAAIDKGEGVAEALAAVEGYTPPAAAAKRTDQAVKRQVSQGIIDLLSANLDALTAGPADDPFNDHERQVAKEKVANICGYLPNVANLTWPENFAPRSGRGSGPKTGK